MVMRRFLLVSLVLLAVFSLKSVCFADPFLNLPTSAVKATFDFNHSLRSYWKITLDGVPVSNDVANGTYASWCVDVDLSVGGSKWVFLIESYDERLFGSINTIPEPDVWDTSDFMPDYNRGNTWDPIFPNEVPVSNSERNPNTDISTYGAQDKVNWILNNWQTVLVGEDDPATVGGLTANDKLDWKEIQTAIWYFVDGIHSSAWTWNDDSKDLIQAAIDSSDGYVPTYGEKIGVILYIAESYDSSAPTFDPEALGQGQYVMISVDRPVPEPGTLLMLSSGLLGLMGYGKLRLNRKKR
jgi:hypothetical protein